MFVFNNISESDGLAVNCHTASTVFGGPGWEFKHCYPRGYTCFVFLECMYFTGWMVSVLIIGIMCRFFTIYRQLLILCSITTFTGTQVLKCPSVLVWKFSLTTFTFYSDIHKVSKDSE